jgi:drug/metabolite transporter (DMT)-like permease
VIRSAPYVFLGTTVFFWGTQYWAIEIAAPHSPPIVITALRTVPAAVALIVVALLLRSRFPIRRLALWTCLTGVIGVALTLGGITEGAARAGGGNTAVLVNTAPFFIVVLGWLFLGEPIARPVALGLAAGFAGVVMVVSPQLDGGGDTGDLALGLSLALVSAVAWAVATLIVKRLTEREPDLDIVAFTAAQYAVGAVALVALAFVLEPVEATDWRSTDLWGSIAYLSLGGSALGYLTYFLALKRLSAGTAGAWLFLIPVVAVIVDAARGTVPEAVVLAGMALAVGGVALVSLPAGVVARRLSPRRL